MRCHSAFLIASPTMASSKPKIFRRRPVFFSAALKRLFLQRTWQKRLRATVVIAQHTLEQTVWWLQKGIWHVPATLSLRTNKIIPIQPVLSPSGMPYFDPINPSLHVYTPPSPSPNAPVLLYVHGGAWGAGSASHYSQLATTLTHKTGVTVLVLSYSLYPASISHQVDQVTAALRRLRYLYATNSLAVLAHSSGAHITALALLQAEPKTPPLADLIMLTAGPFHLVHHYLFESRRGVAHVSPMHPAATDGLFAASPSHIAENFQNNFCSVKLPLPLALEGQLAALNVPLPDVSTPGDMNFPQTYIISSSCDDVVPMYSSIRFTAALRKKGLHANLLVYDGTAHSDFVTDWFQGATSRDHSHVLDVNEADFDCRISYVKDLGGEHLAQVVREQDNTLGPTPYVRDVVRILRALDVERESHSS